MFNAFDLNRLFVPEHTANSPEQRKQIQLFNQLLRSVLARCKDGQSWIRGIEYDSLMEHFVALQRSRVYRLAEENREVLLQDLINRRLNNTKNSVLTGHRTSREALLVQSHRVASFDETYDKRDEASAASLLLLRSGQQEESSPVREICSKEERLALEEAITSLTEREQQAVRLFMEGANYTQVGQALHVSDVYARRVLVGAFRKLREVLDLDRV